MPDAFDTAPPPGDPGFPRLWLAAALLPLCCLVALGWFAWSNVTATARGEMARNLAIAHQQVLRILDTQETVLASMDAFVTGMTWDEIRASRAAHDFARTLAASADAAQTLGVIDPQGRIAVASETPDPPPRVDLSDRDYFRAFPAGTDLRTTFIGAVIASRVDGRIQIHASRPRLNRDRLDRDRRADGGVVASSFVPAEVERLFAEITEAPGMGFALLRADGAVLARTPEPVRQPDEALAPDDPAKLAIALAAEPRAGATVVFPEQPSLLGATVLVGAHPVAKYDLLILHHLDPAVLRDRWIDHMLAPALWSLAAIAVLLAITGGVQRRATREHATLRARTRAAEAGQERAMERAAIEARLRQTEKVAALGQLATGVAHDFNNLLQTIVLNAEALAQAAAMPPSAQRNAALIMRASERGMALTRRMLDFAHRDDRPAEEGATIDITQALRRVHDLLGPLIGSQWTLRLDAEATLPRVRGDASAFELAVVNLAINARDAMPRGGPLVITAARPDRATRPPAGLEPGDYVCVAVRDHGGGMDAATLARVGEAFFTTKPCGKGTGLGLSMARGFARGAGGTLDIQSAPSQGTTVTLWLPAAG